MTDVLAAYRSLIQHLSSLRYTFVCPSPETAGRVVKRRQLDPTGKDAQTVEDFFGWSLSASKPVVERIVPISVLEKLLKESIIVHALDSNTYRSSIRVSNFYVPGTQAANSNAQPLYYIHSAFPASSDAVFFGPDTYLFTSFLRSATRHLEQEPASIIDVCCGSGAGAIHMARTYPRSKTLGLDLNPRALALGGINAELAGTEIEFHESDLYASVPAALRTQGIDLIVSNPPYIASSTEGEDLPIYADGGAAFGLDISMRIVEEGMKILSPGGIIMLYTGVAIPIAKPGYDDLLEKIMNVEGVEVAEYTVLHPDMWSEEIGKGAYADVGRIQVVGAVLRKKRTA